MHFDPAGNSRRKNYLKACKCQKPGMIKGTIVLLKCQMLKRIKLNTAELRKYILPTTEKN